MSRTAVSRVSQDEDTLAFTVDLQPREYRQAMLWYQYRGSAGRRFADLVGWGVLVLTPVLVAALWFLAPEALSPWFWGVATLAYLYALYTAVVVRLQIWARARAMTRTHPLLRGVLFRVHPGGLHLEALDTEGEPATLFVPWKEVTQVARLSDLYVLFVGSGDTVLVIPARCVPDRDRLERLLPACSSP